MNTVWWHVSEILEIFNGFYGISDTFNILSWHFHENGNKFWVFVVKPLGRFPKLLSHNYN